MSYIAVGVGLATTAYKVYDSVHKNNQAKKLARENKRPIFKADGSIREVKDLAASELSSTQLQDFAARNLSQNTSSSIDAILKSGGKMDFATVHQQYGNDLQAALATLSRDRGQRVAAYNNAAYNYAQSENSEFAYNKDAPYKDLKQQEAQLRQQAEQSKADAFSSAASTAGGYLTSTLKPGQYGEHDWNTDGNSNRNATVGARVGQGGGEPLGEMGTNNNFAGQRGNTLNESTNLPGNPPPSYVMDGAVNPNWRYPPDRMVLYTDIDGNRVYRR